MWYCASVRKPVIDVLRLVLSTSYERYGFTTPVGRRNENLDPRHKI